MKRIIALVLTLLTLLSLSTVCAAETTSAETAAKADEMDASVIGSRCFVEKKSIYTDRGAAVTPSSTDSKGSKIVYSVFIGIAAIMICLNLYFLLRG